MADIDVLLVADHPVILGVVRLSCASVPGLRVVGDVDTAPALTSALDGLDPRVVVLDLELSGADPWRVLDLAAAGERKVIVVSERSSGHVVVGSLRRGATGYVLKPDGLRTIGSVVARVASGERVVDPSLEPVVATELGRLARVAREGSRLESVVTAREREVLRLIAEGMTTRQIGRQLEISPRTVESHISKIYRKLGVSSRVQAVARAAALRVIAFEDG